MDIIYFVFGRFFLKLLSFPAGVDFCCVLIIFANILDLDQAGRVVGPDLGPNCLTLTNLRVFLKNFVKK